MDARATLAGVRGTEGIVEIEVKVAGTRVVVGLSGGIDSAIAALLLKQQGWEVIGITLRLFDEEIDQKDGRGCCGSEAVASAKRVAAALGIPLYVRDIRKDFNQLIIDHFCDEYLKGRTPNPCIRCNRLIKLPVLQRLARQLAAEFIATGHYARIKRDANGVWHLYKGVDPAKDQSYFLYTLTQETMAHLLLPLGELTKSAVREMAQRVGLPSSIRQESQDLCFIPDGDYRRFLKKYRAVTPRPGIVYDTEGNVLGEHQGIIGFTIGQRKGLKIPFGERKYVTRIDPERNAVILGKKDEVYQRMIKAEDAFWVSGVPITESFRCYSKVRYQGPGGWAVVEPLSEGLVRVIFDHPQWAPTPGQAVVFYKGNEVIGGATISSPPAADS